MPMIDADIEAIKRLREALTRYGFQQSATLNQASDEAQTTLQASCNA